MPHFTPKQLLLSALGIFVVLIFARFVNVMSFPDSSTVLDKGEPVKIFSNQSLTQTFVAKRDGLSKIEFLLRTPGPSKGDRVQVTLADETCATSLRNTTLEASFLNSDNLYEATFAPTPDSRDQKYCAVITYQKASTPSKSLRFFTTTGTNEAMTFTLPTGEATKNQSLSMRLVYNNASVWQDLRELTERISQYKPFFLKDAFIAAIGITSVLLSTGLIIVLILV